MDVDSRSDQAGDLVEDTILDRTLSLPRVEHGIDGVLKLLHWILRERASNVLLVNRLVFANQFFQLLGGQVSVLLGFVLLFDLAKCRFEVMVVKR